VIAAQWSRRFPCFTLLDNQSQLFKVTFIDQSGTNQNAFTRWFFADIPERCENGKISRWSLAIGRRPLTIGFVIGIAPLLVGLFLNS
jgi:hypothetical protein